MTDRAIVLAKLTTLPALAERMAGLAALRNRVAHGYGSVDFERVWRETPLGVEAFGQFASAIARFIEA